MTNYTKGFFPRNTNYTRKGFKIYTYNITIDNETKRIERTKMIDYKKTIAYYKELGKTVKFEYLGSYWWNEWSKKLHSFSPKEKRLLIF